MGIHIRNRMIIPCATCGKDVSCTRSSYAAQMERAFCSKECKTYYSAKNKLIELVCEECGAMFTKYKVQAIGKHNFCSKECKTRYSVKNKLIELLCEECGVVFTRCKVEAIGKHNFCSQKCSNAGRSKIARAKNMLTCPVCNKRFYRNPAKATRHSKNYCSSICASAALRKERVTVYCKQCSNKFTVLKSREKQFCCNRCKYEFFHEVRTCICGNEFTAHINSTRKTCSEECRYKSRSGKNSAWYVDGRGYEYYNYPQDFRKVATQVRRRDGKCVVCGTRQSQNGHDLEVHHIDHNRENNALDNLVALCRSCHTKETNSKGQERENWVDCLSVFVRSNYTRS